MTEHSTPGGFPANSAPASGTARLVLAEVTSDPIDPARMREAVRVEAAGAVVTFEGVVRDHDAGRTVVALDYEAHPAAERLLRELLTDLAAELPVEAFAVSHRVGALAIGDLAFAVAVSAAHRKEAFAACAVLVDEVKARLPVWKRQQFADGTAEWVGAA
ncbi:molybdenum cofactor biosynthesis protein MoaE [Sediminivirga luteola]|uniref:Molybdenum cofactor biosynthesis protein MoaE n=1 Tax=Sediminivirga luteola TaxID=1774748 RepID=A0A8J2TVA8_9MICO|nr:molybdenum cofactor biosynthesis protein MoaE [Sediminivirga luteola]MCI2265967.1 molybdenum cofactor biosynthesis protein MoaE [Sediminivirga luteola]GGA03476.1 molybdenum cofactor biosynthesis protein MoaE [Sediminivirga luteola]